MAFTVIYWGGGLRTKEKSSINWFKAVGGLKCYLIVDLTQDFDMLRKVDNACFYPKDFSSHMICTPAPWSGLCWGVCGEEELENAWDVLVWESLSQELVFLMLLGLHESCTSQGHDICMAYNWFGCKLEEAVVVRAVGAALLMGPLQFPACLGEGGRLCWAGPGIEKTMLLSSQSNSQHVDNM